MKTNHPFLLLAVVPLALSGLLLGASCLAQPAPSPAPVNELRNVAQLSARAMVEVPQDRLQLFLSTTVQGSDALAVQAQLKRALEPALAEAKKYSKPGELDVRTGNFGLGPRHDPQGRVNGWQGTAELVLDGSDIALVTATAARIQSLTIARVAWGLSAQQRALAEARAQTQAIDNYKRKASDTARSFGFSGYELREVQLASDEPVRYGAPAMALRSMASSDELPVEAGKTLVTVTVSGSVQMR